MESYSITFQKNNDAVFFFVEGYFQKDCGAELIEKVKEVLKDDKTKIVFDFEKCKVINSSGISIMLDIALMIKEDYCGKIVFCGLDALKTKAFKIVGLLSMISVCEKVEQAKELLSQK